MTPDPFVVRGFTDFKTAARILLDRKIRRLPVVDGDGRLVGIFSRKDVIRAALELRNEVK
jgi:CBS domain-containing protein